MHSELNFSQRTAWDTNESDWARKLRQRRESGGLVLDLTAGNPTQCGFHYDTEEILAALINPAALEYDPDPRGLLRAREAVSRYYSDHGAAIDPSQIFLTTSTSEAYSYLFRLLCDPGDEVLMAQPSYPLFDFLATLDDVRLTSYPLFYDYGWHIDVGSLRERITPRTRAVVVVHPNNPTGHFTKAHERRQLEEICVEHGLALIVDEVFLDYPLEAHEAHWSFAAGEHPALTFVLSGLSKVAALPQMKAAWIACLGPAAELGEASARLEVIADTFLSMNAPIQHALPQWLAGRESLQRQIQLRTRTNLTMLDKALSGQTHIGRLIVEAGWYAVLRIPALQPDELTASHLLDAGVAVHPGHFFGFSGSGWLVVSLLSSELKFSIGISKLNQVVQVSNELHSN